MVDELRLKGQGMGEDEVQYWELESPVGRLVLGGGVGELVPWGSGGGRKSWGLRFITIQGGAVQPGRGWVRSEEPFEEALRQLRGYFEGRVRGFSLPLCPEGTGFEKEVWGRLVGVGYGETVSYGWLAGEVGRPKGARAVGRANGKNPLPIVVPCHRVVAANGDLGGYSCGLGVKASLLEMEGRYSQELDRPATTSWGPMLRLP